MDKVQSLSGEKSKICGVWEINKMDKTHEGCNRRWIFVEESLDVGTGVQVFTLGENLGKCGR